MSLVGRWFRFSLATGLVALGALFACDTSGPTVPPPSGPAPAVEFDARFGDPPLAGSLHLTPSPKTLGWRYRVEGIASGGGVHAGALDGPVSIPYRFESLGSHRIRVELTGPEGVVEVEKRLVVTDPASDFVVLDLLPVEEIWPDESALSPEGIAIDHYGVYLYVGNYTTGEVVQVDAWSLEPLAERRYQLLPGVEGLALTPSSQRLLAIHKHDFFSVASTDDRSIVWQQVGLQGHFVGVLDESHALVSGYVLTSVNLASQMIEHRADAFHARHFAIDRSRGRVAVSNLSGKSLDLLALPALETIRSIPLGPLWPQQVAFDPHENKVYVVAFDGEETTFLVLDPSTGARLASIPLGPGACSGYCAANPVATFGSGRYVAFEQPGSVLVVDTELDQPRHRFGVPPVGVRAGPAGVAAQPDSDILYVLGGPYDALTKIRLR